MSLQTVSTLVGNGEQGFDYTGAPDMRNRSISSSRSYMFYVMLCALTYCDGGLRQ
jgi:hypothetical protein